MLFSHQFRRCYAMLFSFGPSVLVVWCGMLVRDEMRGAAEIWKSKWACRSLQLHSASYGSEANGLLSSDESVLLSTPMTRSHGTAVHPDNASSCCSSGCTCSSSEGRNSEVVKKVINLEDGMPCSLALVHLYSELLVCIRVSDVLYSSVLDWNKDAV